MPLFYSKRLPTGGVRIRRADGGSAEDMDSFRELAELHAADMLRDFGCARASRHRGGVIPSVTHATDAVGRPRVRRVRSVNVRKNQPSFEAELASLPAPYEGGLILLAERGGEVIGSLALKAHKEKLPSIDAGERVCELKRMYVRKSCRGQGVGGRLVDACLEAAIEAGFTLAVLDTANKVRRRPMISWCAREEGD